MGRDGRFAISVAQQYRIVEDEAPRGPWKVKTIGYAYTLGEAANPSRVFLAYHWHPHGHSDILYPHLHIYQCAEIRRTDGREAHFPTGRIALEEVLRLMIREFGVIPVRSDWEAVLDRTQSAFEDWRTWP